MRNHWSAAIAFALPSASNVAVKPSPPPSTLCTSRPLPRLILAPMENLADRTFRIAQASIGGADEAVHEFIRIPPVLPSIPGVLRRYDPDELPIPLAAQIMGSNPQHMYRATKLLVEMGAPRVDLNCGCPSRIVTGNGAGSSLLRVPEVIYEIVRAMILAADGRAKVSVKVRSGYESTANFDEVIQAVVEGGAHMVTVHPRTKVQAYNGFADWQLIARAKQICGDVMVIGNGDVLNGEDAVRMVKETGCDGVMVGRGAVKNPWVFWEIRKAFGDQVEQEIEKGLEGETNFYLRYLKAQSGVKGRSTKKESMKIGKFKLLLKYSTSLLEEDRRRLLRITEKDATKFVEEIIKALRRYYQ